MKNKLKLLILCLIPFFASADWLDINLPVGATDISEEVFELHMLIFWVVVGIGVLVFGFLFWSLWKYRRSNNKKPANFTENHKLEIIWTIVPTVILILMAIPASATLKKIYDHEAEEGGIDIQVTGRQWDWQYKYLDEYVDENNTRNLSFVSTLVTPEDQYKQNRATKDENYLLEVDKAVVVPINTPIRFLITSKDVLHSWYMRDFAVKQDAIPGFINVAKTKINVPGTYRGNCTELCGDRHAFMPIVVKAVTADEYQEWLQSKREEHAELVYLTEKEWTLNELMGQGKEIYEKVCAACHQQDGQGIPNFYPALAGSDIVMNDKARQIEILMEGVYGTQMKAYNEDFNEVEMASVITYTKFAWGNDKTDSQAELVIPKDIVDYKNKDT